LNQWWGNLNCEEISLAKANNQNSMSRGVCYIQGYKIKKRKVIIMDKESSPFKWMGIVHGKMITIPN